MKQINKIILKNDPIFGCFVGDMYIFDAVWSHKHACYVHKPKEQGGKFRFRINFIMQEPGSSKYKALVFEQGFRFFKELKNFKEQHGSLDYYVKIKKEGEGRLTGYTIEKIQPLTFVTKKMINNVPLQRLDL